MRVGSGYSSWSVLWPNYDYSLSSHVYIFPSDDKAAENLSPHSIYFILIYDSFLLLKFTI